MKLFRIDWEYANLYDECGSSFVSAETEKEAIDKWWNDTDEVDRRQGIYLKNIKEDNRCISA
jgi:hypothetical protein